MLKAGFIQKWKADFWPSQDRCSSTAYGGAGRQKKVDLEDMQGSFYLLLLGKKRSMNEYLSNTTSGTAPGTARPFSTV